MKTILFLKHYFKYHSCNYVLLRLNSHKATSLPQVQNLRCETRAVFLGLSLAQHPEPPQSAPAHSLLLLAAHRPQGLDALFLSGRVWPHLSSFRCAQPERDGNL